MTGYAPAADPTAVFGRRVVAWLIDALIGIGVVVIAFAALAESQDVGSSREAERICDFFNNVDDGASVCINADSTVILAEGSDIGTIFLVALIYGIATQVILPTLTGGSLGKLMVGLRVVDKNTFARAGFGKQILRWILWVADGLLCGPLIGGIVALSSKGHRRVGDLAAGTFVVDRKHVDHPVAVPGANDLPALASQPLPYAPTAPPTTPPPPTTAPPAPPIGATAPPPPVFPPPAPTSTAPEPPAPEPPVPPVDAPAADETTAFDAPPVDAPAADETTAFDAPAADAPPPPVEAPSTPPPAPAPAAPPPPAAPEPAARPGVDAPQWDEARDTYIQWDPELEEWMEWSEASGRWIPISQ